MSGAMYSTAAVVNSVMAVSMARRQVRGVDGVVGFRLCVGLWMGSHGGRGGAVMFPPPARSLAPSLIRSFPILLPQGGLWSTMTTLDMDSLSTLLPRSEDINVRNVVGIQGE